MCLRYTRRSTERQYLCEFSSARRWDWRRTVSGPGRVMLMSSLYTPGKMKNRAARVVVRERSERAVDGLEHARRGSGARAHG